MRTGRPIGDLSAFGKQTMTPMPFVIHLIALGRASKVTRSAAPGNLHEPNAGRYWTLP